MSEYFPPYHSRIIFSIDFRNNQTKEFLNITSFPNFYDDAFQTKYESQFCKFYNFYGIHFLVHPRCKKINPNAEQVVSEKLFKNTIIKNNMDPRLVFPFLIRIIAMWSRIFNKLLQSSSWILVGVIYLDLDLKLVHGSYFPAFINKCIACG